MEYLGTFNDYLKNKSTSIMEKETNLTNYKFIVYQTVNKINNKIYVGVHKTKSPNVFDGYIGGGIYINSPSSYSKPNSPYQYAVKKYGPSNFIRSIIKIFDNMKEAYQLEAEIVNYDFIKRADTYNAQLGGFSGGFRINTTYQFNTNGELLKEWDTILEASEYFNVSHTAILNAVKFKECCNGFYWAYSKSIDISEYSRPNVGTTCYMYDADTRKYISRFLSIQEASKITGFLKSNIQRALKGNYKVGNYYFSTKLMEEYIMPNKISLKNKIIYIYNLNGDFLYTANNTTELKNYLGIKSTNPVNIALRQHTPYKQWQFSLEKIEKMEKVINKRNISKKVGRYNFDNELLETYDSITKAINIYGTGVQRVLKNQQRHCKGFIFKFIKD